MAVAGPRVLLQGRNPRYRHRCALDALPQDRDLLHQRKQEYDVAGTVSHSEANELRAFVIELQSDVMFWLKEDHPGLVLF